MSSFVKFQLSDGSAFVAEVDEVTEVHRVTRGADTRTELISESSQTFETALASVKQAAEALVDRLCDLAKPPDELTVEFGVKLSAETGALIAKASTDANFTITLKWKRDSGEEG